MVEFLTDFAIMLIYGAEISVAFFLCFRSEEEKHISALKAAVSAVGTLLASVCFALAAYFVPSVPLGVWAAFCVVISAAASYAAMAVRGARDQSLFCMGVAFLTRFAAVKIWFAFAHIMQLNDLGGLLWLLICMRIIIVAAVYAVIRVFVVSGYFVGSLKYSNRTSALFGVFVSAVTFGLGFTDVFLSSYSLAYCIILNFCEVFYGIMMLFVAYALINRERLEADAVILKKMWMEDRKHYELQRESMELVNIRCHDIKHQLQSLRREGASIERVIDGLEDSVNIYGSFINTGNEVLDVIMSNFSVRCRSAKTQFTCMADGAEVGFMEELDAYSLFGNMLDNALECEQKIFPEEDRFISVTVRRSGDFLSVHEENYITGDVQITDGTAPTSKADKAYHGFGMKSMKLIAEKYGGTFDAFVRDDMFQVNVLIPIPAQQDGADSSPDSAAVRQNADADLQQNADDARQEEAGNARQNINVGVRQVGAENTPGSDVNAHQSGDVRQNGGGNEQ